MGTFLVEVDFDVFDVLGFEDEGELFDDVATDIEGDGKIGVLVGGVNGCADVDEDTVGGEENVAHFCSRIDTRIWTGVAEEVNNFGEGDAPFGDEFDTRDFRACGDFGVEGG